MFYGINTIEILKDIQKNIGVPIKNYNRCVTYNAGFVNALDTFADYANECPDSDARMLISLDDHSSGKQFNTMDEAAQEIGSGNHILLAIYRPNYTINDIYYEKWIKEYGMNTIKMERDKPHM